MKKYTMRLGLISLLFLVCFVQVSANVSISYKDPVTKEMSIEDKRSSRRVMLKILLDKYNQNQTFSKMHQFMIEKFNELEKNETPPYPDNLIAETLDKTRSVYEKTQSIVGRNFKRLYDPEQIETSIQKYLWLKGLCFFILGIDESHKIAFAYFYQTSNDKMKKEFLKDAVKYSYPEVPDIPENKPWFDKMNGVMERLGYKVFNVEKYISSPN